MSLEMKSKQAQAEQAVAAAKGHDADYHFLHHMIDHHKDGIQMMQASMPNLQHQELRSMVRRWSRTSRRRSRPCRR